MENCTSMEKRKNFLSHTVTNQTLLPVEQEMLSSVCGEIEKKLGMPISAKSRISSEVLFDVYLLSCDKRTFILKVNLSPELPNFWKTLCENNFQFHPLIIAWSFSSEFAFYCYETTKTFPASSLTESILSKRLGVEHIVANTLSQIHSVKLSENDGTREVLNSFMPIEATASSSLLPIVNLFSQCKQLFAKTYKPTTDIGICHFDFSPRNLLIEGETFKLVNFEYAGNANIYIDTLLAKRTLNASDESFNNLLSYMDIDKKSLVNYIDAEEIFAFCYFNSKIIAEYLTFGTRNIWQLRHWIVKSSSIYDQIKSKFFLEKSIDNSIQSFYDAWRQ